MSIKDPTTHVPDFDLEAPRPEAKGLPSVAEQVGKAKRREEKYSTEPWLPKV